MSQKAKKLPFKDKQTGYHRSAVKILAEWVDGLVECPFYIEDSIAFVPDVTVRKNDIIESIYEVVYSHPVDGKKLGMMQYWCYLNGTSFEVFEVSADFILKQTCKPGRIEIMEYYLVDPFQDVEFELHNLPY